VGNRKGESSNFVVSVQYLKIKEVSSHISFAGILVFPRLMMDKSQVVRKHAHYGRLLNVTIDIENDTDGNLLRDQGQQKQQQLCFGHLFASEPRL
jgi:hypothetical protein